MPLFSRFTFSLFHAAPAPQFSFPHGQVEVPLSPSSRSTRLVSELFGLDIRSLALFRIGLGLLLCADLLQRAFDLRAHYTDFGVLPRGVALSQFLNPWLLSLHLLGGTVFIEALLFAIAGVCALALLVGYHTRLATILSWFFLISLHNRNPIICDGGDAILRLVLFWAMFLPLGAAYALDNLQSSHQRRPERVASVATVALLLQICFVYWFAFALKTAPEWREDGSAVYYALSLDSFTAPLGIWLRQFTSVLPLLSFATLALEGLGPCLLFIPFCRGPVRFGTVCLFLGLHAGLGLFLALGIFPWIAMVAWLALFPTWFWRTLAAPRDLTPRRTEALRERLRRFVPLPAASAPVASASAVGRLSPPVAGFCFLCLLYVTLWNLRTIDFPYASRVLPTSWDWIGFTLRLDQRWDMFAPRPATDDGWYVIPAQLRDGREVDLMSNGGPVRWEKPANVAATFRNQHWRKYLRTIWERTHASHRPYFAQYLCRDWNSSHPPQEFVQTFAIYYMQEDTLPDNEAAPPEKVLLWTQKCFEL